ncbi:MAG: hypothetical protein QGH60_05775 [Phycisphaerae bacterium]|jgi:hypothetical protein|nr:hypothetical protein [Phycisphaerae bacterium]
MGYRRIDSSLGLVVLLAAAVTFAPAPAAGDDNKPLGALRKKLAGRFDTLVGDPKSYRARVSRECGRFPEGDIFPYTFPAIAYANLALSDPGRRKDALDRIPDLLVSAIASTAAKVKPPGGKLERLKSYRNHATYLGQLNMALGYYRLIGGDDRYRAINRAISNVLHKALVELEGRPLESFPTYSWTFDTIAALVSLKLYDLSTGKGRSDAVIRKHLEWMSKRAIHKPTGLPYSRINNATARGTALPRGCDLSLRISLIAHLDAPLSKTMYDAYVKAFWIDRKIVSGFAEWPGGRAGKQDADSGPILMGIGMTASGMGLAAAASTGDTRRAARLAGQTVAFKSLMRQIIVMQPRARTKLTLGGKIDPSSDYVTGFLYGDICLFYALTWQALPKKSLRP